MDKPIANLQPKMAHKRVLSFNNSSEIVKKQKSDVQHQDTIACDENGQFVCNPGEIIRGEYKILNILGEGQFGRVIMVQDLKTLKKSALKMLRNADAYRSQGRLEAMTLKDIAALDTDGTSLCIKLLNTFEYHGHICIEFEALGLSVLHFLQDNDFAPFPANHIRHIAYQLCHSVNFLHKNGITHTDLKPDNFLFVDSSYKNYHSSKLNRDIRIARRTDIRLIDFGSAVYDTDYHTTTISNRFYRAPEVILKLGWSQPVDVWSLACVFFELYSGPVLFPTQDDDLEHLVVMEKRLGAFPDTMIDKTNTKYFTNGKVNSNWTIVPILEHFFQALELYLHSTNEDEKQLFDLIKKMLEYEPAQRSTLSEALSHPFFDKLPSYQRLL